MSILITGATGFIGGALAFRLLRDGHRDIVTFSKKPIQAKATEHYCCDLGDPKNVGKNDAMFAKICREHNPEIIFHLAGNPSSKLDRNNPYKILFDNIISTQRVLNHAPENCRVVFASSIIVYGDWLFDKDPQGKYVETDNTHPTSVYGMTKLASENLVDLYSNMGTVNGVSLRLCATVGKAATHGVVKDFVRKLSEPLEYLEILGDPPGSTKPYCHIDDVVDALILLANSKESGAFNVLPEDSINIEQVANAVMEATNIHKPIEWLGEAANWKGDNRIIRASNQKLRSLGWAPKFKSEDAIREASNRRLTPSL